MNKPKSSVNALGGDGPRGTDPHEASTPAQENATVLNQGAEMMRSLVPLLGDGPVAGFVPVASSRLLDAIADALRSGNDLPDQLVQRALELARHVLTYGPDVAAEPASE